MSEENTKRSPDFQAWMAETLSNVAKTAYDFGFKEGFNAGSVTGYVTAVDTLKPALSDGLRHGSSECGKVMQSLKNMDAISSGPEDKDLNTNEDDDNFEEDNWNAGYYSEDDEEE